MALRRLVVVCLASAVAAGAVAVPVASAAVAQSVVVAGLPAAGTPQVLDGRVQAIIQVGGTIVVGGKFTQVRQPGGPILARKNLFAFDADTGAISTSFTPAIAGGSVFTLQPGGDGASVIAGGRFLQVDGKAQTGLAQLSLADGSRVKTFNARIKQGAVLSSALSNGRLFVAGTFTMAGGLARSGLAQLDGTTGAVDPAFNFAVGGIINGPVQATHVTVSPDGSKLVVTGPFTTIDGQPRAQIAMIDVSASPAVLSDWSTPVFDPNWLLANGAGAPCAQSTGGNIRGVDFAPDSSYLVVGTTGGNTSYCDSVTRFEANGGGGQMPTWDDPTGGDSITQVAVTGTTIYVGGHQRWMENLIGNSQGPGAIPRAGIAALDPVNGMPFSWNPGRKPRGTGVYAFLATADGLWVGGDSTSTAGMLRPRIAFFPTAGGTAVPPPAIVPDLPGQLGSVGSAGLATTPFDGTAAGQTQVLASVSPWVGTTGGFMIGSTLYAFTSSGQLISAPFDGHVVGASQVLPLRGLVQHVRGTIGAHYDPATGRLYYGVQGDSRLFWRPFEAQDQLLGAPETEVGQLPTDIIAFTVVGSQFVYADNGGNLNEIAWNNGNPSGTPVTLSGPGVDGHDWRGTSGLFVSPN